MESFQPMQEPKKKVVVPLPTSERHIPKRVLYKSRHRDTRWNQVVIRAVHSLKCFQTGQPGRFYDEIPERRSPDGVYKASTYRYEADGIVKAILELRMFGKTTGGTGKNLLPGLATGEGFIKENQK